MLLEISHLTTEFAMKKGTVRPVNDVSFSIEHGEVLAIVGESGSGKTVASLSIMGLLQSPGKVVGGTIMYNERDLAQCSQKEMRAIRGNHISMIFQEPMTSLNPVYTVENQLVEAIVTHTDRNKREAVEHAINMLRLVGIPSPETRIKDYPHQMSGGMRQRIMVAMALACDPELLIADEPTTALDVTIQAQILELMLDLRVRIGMAILLITHDLAVVAETADRVIVMYCGQIVEKATADQLFEEAPLHPYTLGLLKSIPDIEDSENGKPLYMIPGMVPNLLYLPKGCAFARRCPWASARCHNAEPPSYVFDQREVCCFLYENATLEQIDAGSILVFEDK